MEKFNIAIHIFNLLKENLLMEKKMGKVKNIMIKN